MTGQAGTDHLRRLTWKLWALTVGANFLVALAFYVGLLSWHNAYFPDLSVWRIFGLIAWVGAIYFAASTTHAYFRIRKVIRPGLRWIPEVRTSTPEERLALARAPRRIGGTAGFYWLLPPIWGVPLFSSIRGYEDLSSFLLVKIITAWVALGFAATMLSYLLVERGLRRERAAAFFGETMLAGHKTMGMFTKLILAWAGSALLPIGSMALFLVGTTPDQRLRSAPVVWTTGGVGLVAGIAVTIYAARAIVDPINRVRRGLRRIGEGNLDTVDVDEAGELGLLQAGVNQMVTGLRERERMRELFGHHVGAEVASRALSGEGALGGERRDATAMFVDVIGSSYLVDREDPDEVVEILNRFFDLVVRVVAAEGGIVNKFEGDGALCVFGAPNTLTDHAARALRAGERLQRELSTIATDIGAAIGIASGSVAAGNIGAADRYEYTVIGRPVHVARRLCDEAKLTEARLLASESTISSAGAHDTGWIAADAVLLRGQSEMTATYVPPQS
jgi:adenylate cyclase